MDVALVIIIAVLFVLVAVVSLKGRRARRAARNHQEGEARVIAEKSKAQHEESERRQAGVRAAHAEGASKSVSDPDE
jgi:Na+-transporting methylmalonyl-CoA/oxaloacetate decarboxylase gamma subunit